MRHYPRGGAWYRSEGLCLHRSVVEQSRRREVKKRYRFGRLWIVGTTYSADGDTIRYSELAGVSGDDEPDGGPPVAARYITLESNPYRLPSMELSRLIYDYDAYRRYLEGALAGG